MTHQNLSLGMCWKLFWTTLIKLSVRKTITLCTRSVMMISFPFPCFLSFEGLVNRILSARFWIPLSRLTYCAYLVHIIALIVVGVSYENVQAYSDVHTVSNICLIMLMNLTCVWYEIRFYDLERFASALWCNYNCQSSKF